MGGSCDADRPGVLASANLRAMAKRHRFTIVGLGEALFDIFAGQERLGGAPLNVAVQAHQLAQPVEGRGVAVSRVGQDDLGDALRQQLRDRGMDTRYIQSDPDRPTGQVFVDIGPGGQPHYDIVKDSAWDMLWFDSDLEDLAQTCNAVCFGTLAQRDAQTRNAIYRFLHSCRRATRLFDVNLRPPYYDGRTLRRSCEKAEIIKMNVDEVPTVCEQVGIVADTEDAQTESNTSPDRDAANHARDDKGTDVSRGGEGAEVSRGGHAAPVADKQAAASGASRDRAGAVPAGLDTTLARQADTLRRRYGLQMVVISRGELGTTALTEAGWHEGEAAEYPFAENATGVGAGDACVAGILIGNVLRFTPERTMTLANYLGAYVAACEEATPQLPGKILEIVNV